jgi:hypothetical protein
MEGLVGKGQALFKGFLEYYTMRKRQIAPPVWPANVVRIYTAA